MLNESEIRALIICRLQSVTFGGESAVPVLNQARGLIAVLNGEMPGFSWDARAYYDAAVIPYTAKIGDDGEDMIEISDEYLATIGCTSDEDGEVFHPKFNPA